MKSVPGGSWWVPAMVVLILGGAAYACSSSAPMPVLDDRGAGSPFAPDTRQIDAHMHCDGGSELALDLLTASSADDLLNNPAQLDPVTESLFDSCLDDTFDLVVDAIGPVEGVLLSQSFGAVGFGLKVAEAATSSSGTINDPRVRVILKKAGAGTAELYLRGARQRPDLHLYAALDCFYDTPLTAPTFAEACKADARRWLRAGAVGFKDYIGGNSVREWNRVQGFCPDAGLDSCLAEETARFLHLEPAWREVLAYILDDLKVPIVSHTVYSSTGHTCYDAIADRTGPCEQVTSNHTLELARWLQATLPPAAVRRFIVAHLGLALPGRHDLENDLRLILDTGVSADISANNVDLLSGGCELRDLFGAYAEQIVFGTDKRSNRIGTDAAELYAALVHVITAPWERKAPFATRVVGAPEQSPGLGLMSPLVSGCDAVVAADTAERIMFRNMQAMYPAESAATPWTAELP